MMDDPHEYPGAFDEEIGDEREGQQANGGNGRAKPQPFVLHWHGEADFRESRPYCVQDLIPEVGSGLVSGQWGTYKTFAVLDLANCIMSGEPFLDCEVVRRGGVLFIAAEGASEVPIRLQGVIEHKGKGVLLPHAPFAWMERSPRLLSKSGEGLAELVKIATAVGMRSLQAWPSCIQAGS
jgi:hypothetical protein